MDEFVGTQAAPRRSGARGLVLAAVTAAVTCVLSPFAVPVGPVSVTLGVLAICLASYLLGWKLGMLSCLVYILLGFAGLPVFSGFRAGAAVLLGPTGGYVVGYLPMAAIAGLAAQRLKSRAAQFCGMAAGVGVLYAFGTAWYCIQANVPLAAALAGCVYPFIPFDLAKLAVITAAGPALRERLERAGAL